MTRHTVLVATLAVGSLLAADSARADLVILDFDPDINVGQGFFQNIALIGTPGTPGSQDFAVNNFFATGGGTYQQLFMPFLGSTAITTGDFVGGFPVAAMFEDGDVIGADTIATGPTSFNPIFAHQGLQGGEWYDATESVTGIAGFQFVNNSDTHYGWVEVTVSPVNGGTISIDRAAYESRPFEPVTVVVPEPTTAAFFGLASAGLLARRRR